jgi:hypothetical protein
MTEKTTSLVVSGIPEVYIKAVDALVIRTHLNESEIRVSRSAKVAILLEEALLARGAMKRDKTGNWTLQHQTIYVGNNQPFERVGAQ